jgi:hypothetical protein
MKWADLFVALAWPAAVLIVVVYVWLELSRALG